MFRFGAAAQAPTKICGNTRHMPRHGLMPRTAEFVAPGVASTGKFGRLLPYLDPLRVGDESLVELASKMLESVGGTDDNPDVPAAYTYLGQFIDHNVTFDATSIEEARIDPASVVNYRSPRLDLDSVYGSGPVVQPHLYQRDDPDLLEIGCAQHFTNARRSNKVVADIGFQADLPRGWNRFALIADPRNDENLIVAQLHLAFLHFHNNIVGWLRTDSARRQAPLRKSVFVEARDLAIRHYQWIVLHDFLPRIVCREVLEEVRRGKSMMAEQNRLYMPVEFSAAAYRFGHSALRPLYNINSAHLKAPLLDLFKFSGRTGSRAQVPITDNWIVEWFRLLNLDPGYNLNRAQSGQMMDVFDELVRLRNLGQKCALATIVEVNGSIPSFQTAKLLVREDGSLVGTIGGGCVEAEVWNAAREVMQTGKPRNMSFSLGQDAAYDNGLICGGQLEVSWNASRLSRRR
jgi:hypothetical protein